MEITIEIVLQAKRKKWIISSLHFSFFRFLFFVSSSSRSCTYFFLPPHLLHLTGARAGSPAPLSTRQRSLQLKTCWWPLKVILGHDLGTQAVQYSPKEFASIIFPVRIYLEYVKMVFLSWTFLSSSEPLSRHKHRDVNIYLFVLGPTLILLHLAHNCLQFFVV